LPPRTIVLPAWLTPAFAARWLKAGDLAEHPRGGQSYSQLERYRAIAAGVDWSPRRRCQLTWQEPYTGHYLADLVAEAEAEKAADDAERGAPGNDNGHDPRLAFWHIAKRAIADGDLSPRTVNALARQAHDRDGWGSALEQLRERVQK